MKIVRNYIVLMLTTLTVLTSCKDDEELYPQLGDDPRNIGEIVSETEDLSTMAGALESSGLDATLSTTTTYTVFAPNNAAFSSIEIASYSEEELENLLLNHVISTTTADFSQTLETGYLSTMALGPNETNLSFYVNVEGDARFNGMASLVDDSYDIGATNGVIHVVDNVLTPPTLLDHIQANANYSVLANAIEMAGMASTFTSVSADEGYPFTVFAPTNDAFEALLADLNGAFGWDTLEDVPTATLSDILSYHLIEGANNTSSDVLGSELTTSLGDTFSISAEGLIGDASYSDANITLTDIQAVNGMMHGVDKVLLPDSVFQSVLSATLDIVERSEDRGYSSFLAAVNKAGLSETLMGGEYTVFVPSNEAFTAMFATIGNFESLDDFDTEEELAVLSDLLMYHVVEGTVLASQLSDGQSITTVYGDNITVDLSGDSPRLKPSFEEAIPSTVSATNIGATNGVIHEINRVLVPEALLSALGIEVSDGGQCPVGDPALVFFDWDANGAWWGNVTAENDAALSLDGSSYGRANFQTGGTGWQDLFWRNDPSTFNGADVVGANLEDYVLKFDINVIEPLAAGAFRIRFNSGGNGGADSFYDWAPWNDTGEPFTTDGWETVEIPLSVLGQPDFSLVNAEFGMAFEGADVLLNFAIDNVRFDSPGCGGVDPVDDTNLVFFDWDANGAWWGNVVAENDAAISLDGSNYGRANFQTGGEGWQDLFWRNDPSTFNGAATVGSNLEDYVLKFDINTLEPLTAGMFRIRFNSGGNGGADSFYDWAPWNDTGEPFETDGWVTVEIPLTLLGQPDFSLVDAEFGMAFEGADVLLNFAIDNVRFESNE